MAQKPKVSFSISLLWVAFVKMKVSLNLIGSGSFPFPLTASVFLYFYCVCAETPAFYSQSVVKLDNRQKTGDREGDGEGDGEGDEEGGRGQEANVPILFYVAAIFRIAKLEN